MTERWTFSDAWFFEAVAQAASSEVATLTDVIAAGDAINHSIFNRDEIEHAVNRLAGSGLLARTADRFALTRAASDLRGRCPANSVFDRMTWLERALAEFTVVDGPDWRLDGRVYSKATAEHQRRFGETYERRYGKYAEQDDG